MNQMDVITEIRGFNQFFTNTLNVLNQHILDAGYSPEEAKVIFEISKADKCTIDQLSSVLDIEKNRISQLIRKFSEEGIVDSHNVKEDDQNAVVKLTAKGDDIFEKLNDDSDKQIQAIISGCKEEEQKELLHAIRTVKKYFSKTTKKITYRTFRADDVDFIIDRQLSLYRDERNFTSPIWVGYVTQGVHKLVEQFDSAKDVIYIAECNGNRAGCIAVTHTEEGTAQLRYFFLEPEVRGMGIGGTLIAKAVEFCKEKGYSEAFLWTVSAQKTARRLYEKAGFAITETHENDEWGVYVLEEKWEKKL